MPKKVDRARGVNEALRLPASPQSRAKPLAAQVRLTPDLEGAPDAMSPAILCSSGQLVRRDDVELSAAGAETERQASTIVEVTGSEIPGLEAFRERVQDLLSAAKPSDAALAGISAATDAFYDFDEYIFLRDIDDPYVDPNSNSSVPRVPVPTDARMARFSAAARTGVEFFVDHAARNARALPPLLDRKRLEDDLHLWWRTVCLVRSFNALARYNRTKLRANRIQGITGLSPEDYYGYSLYFWLLNRALPQATGYFDGGTHFTLLGKLVKPEFWEEAVDGVFADSFQGIPASDEISPVDEYPFDPFPVNEVLFGLQVIHRQSWRLLGHGRGELVKSIPLGPRETQKVSVKVTTRTKLQRSSEESSSFETSSESSTSSKDTAEVVAEASEKLNRHAEAEVSGGYGPFVQAKVSAGIAEDLASSSRQTKSRLNEVMQKTAGRMKRDTRVTVSTEKEETYEVSRASELVNPNDEIAVTYLYHRLQQRYWVSTAIAEVHSVVFVPEALPDPDDITEAWISVHAGAISTGLLDQGFAGILNTLRKEPSGMPYRSSTSFERGASAAVAATTDFKNYVGQGTMPDFLESGQRYNERELSRRNAHESDVARRNHQAIALIAHIRRNILHYMRAIWSREDFDQRMQRYARLRVPTTWRFIPRAAAPSGSPPPTPLQAEGFFTPDDGSAKPLTQVIDPIGPIGYLFNCAIYRLRDDNRLANTHQALAYLRANYVRFAVSCTPSAGAGVTVRQAVAFAPTTFSSDYELVYFASSRMWKLSFPGVAQSAWRDLAPLPGGAVDVLGIRIWLEGTPADQARLAVSVRVTSEPEDPHVRMLRMQSPLPTAADEPGLFTGELLSRIRDVVAAVRVALPADAKWGSLDAAQKAIVRNHYHEYLVLRESGRLVPLETGNVVLDLEVGTSPVLEPFKRLHRYIDVLREYEVLRKHQLENQRREALLKKGVLGDPEIEKVSVISTDPSFAHLASIAETDPNA